MLVRFIFGLCVLACSGLVEAGKPHALMLDWIIENSNQVFIGKVVLAEVSGDDGAVCPSVRYVVSVEKVVHGLPGTFEFCSEQELAAGGRNVFFLDHAVGSESDALIGALSLTRSFLDPDIEWVEVNSVSGVNPTPLEIEIEQVERCIGEDESRTCRTIHARELVALNAVLERVEEKVARRVRLQESEGGETRERPALPGGSPL